MLLRENNVAHILLIFYLVLQITNETVEVISVLESEIASLNVFIYNEYYRRDFLLQYAARKTSFLSVAEAILWKHTIHGTPDATILTLNRSMMEESKATVLQ